MFLCQFNEKRKLWLTNHRIILPLFFIIFQAICYICIFICDVMMIKKLILVNSDTQRLHMPFFSGHRITPQCMVPFQLLAWLIHVALSYPFTYPLTPGISTQHFILSLQISPDFDSISPLNFLCFLVNSFVLSFIVHLFSINTLPLTPCTVTRHLNH